MLSYISYAEGMRLECHFGTPRNCNRDPNNAPHSLALSSLARHSPPTTRHCPSKLLCFPISSSHFPFSPSGFFSLSLLFLYALTPLYFFAVHFRIFRTPFLPSLFFSVAFPIRTEKTPGVPLSSLPGPRGESRRASSNMTIRPISEFFPRMLTVAPRKTVETPTFY